ncbi:MAG: carbohydrate ABC transporter permease [Clostridia bacterium]|nr:carbohydrate ABC transporter permease [Clostridia bacterium]
MQQLAPAAAASAEPAVKVPTTGGKVTTITFVTVLIAGFAAYLLISGQPLFDSFNTIFFGLFTVLCVFPFYYLFINTISANDAVVSGKVNFLPEWGHALTAMADLKAAGTDASFLDQIGAAIKAVLQNYIALKDVADLGASILVTVARTIFGTALMVMVSAWAGYMVTKQKMYKRSLLYRLLVITMYFNAGLIPWYMNMLMLGLTESFWAYIIPGVIAPYNIILVKTYIESIPASLEESAVIDGASTPQVFVKIILPLSVPILATIAIFGAVGNWNSFQDSLLLMNSKTHLFTLQHRLYVYLNSSSNLGALVSGSGGLSTQAAQSMLNARVIKYTVSMVSIIPILLVYPFMQRFFVKGIMLGAVKG